MNELYYLCEPAADFVEAWLCYHFIGLFLWERSGKKRGGKKGTFLLLSLILVVSVQGMKQFGIDPLISTLWFVFYICMTAAVLFQVDVFYSVSLVSFYILCVYIIDFFCLSVMGVLGGNRQFAKMVMSQLSLWRVLYLAVNKVLLFLFYLLARWALKRTVFYNVRVLFSASFLGLLGVGFLSWLTMEETTVHSLFSWSLCLLMLFLLYFLLRFYSDYREERELRELRELKDQMVRREYADMKHRQEERELLAHDMKNHMLLLRSMLEEQRVEEAKLYLERVGEPFLSLAPAVYTGNAALDLLLSRTKQRAEQLGIRFTVQADAVSLDQMSEEDICCLFSNLLDNACEAASVEPVARCVSGDLRGASWIHVKLRRTGQMLFVEIKNSMAGRPEEQSGRLLSAKRDGRMHGLGLQSAQRAALRYGGDLEYAWKEGVFRVNVTFLGGILPVSPKGRNLRTPESARTGTFMNSPGKD